MANSNTDNFYYRLEYSRGIAEYMHNHAAEYKVNPTDAYLVGLLHKVGYLTGGENLPDEGAKILERAGLTNEIVYAVQNQGIEPKSVDDPILPYHPMLALLLEAKRVVNSNGVITKLP